MTHRDEATEYVSLWIVNDGDYYHHALDVAESGNLAALATFVEVALNCAPHGSAAWYVRRELSANELNAIDWAYIASCLVTE